MKHQSLFLRADASSQIGTGHVMRCLALAQAWMEQADCGNLKPEVKHPSSVLFICADMPEALEQRLKDEGFAVARIDATPGSADDVRQTLSVMDAFRLQVSGFRPPPSPPWFVTDGYLFDLAYQKAIRSAGFKLLVIDDYNHLPEYACDVLLNVNVGAEGYEYHVNADARRLLGPRYTLLRREFREAARASRDWKPEGAQHPIIGNRILVTLGGSDRNNVTARAIEAIGRISGASATVRVVVGAANPHYEALKSGLPAGPHRFELLRSVSHMPELMSWADLAVSAGGGTCWELALMGVPMVLVSLAENQQRIVETLVSRGVAAYGETGERVDAGRLATELARLRTEPEKTAAMRDRALALVDGLGAGRVAEALAPSAAESLTLRPAQAGDRLLFFSWVNEPGVRANSLRPDPISLEEHTAWFDARLGDPNSRLYVLEARGLPIGQIRFDEKEGAAWIDYSLDVLVRGRGWGKTLVQLGLAAFRPTYDGPICAEVKSDNCASAATFVRLGFEGPRELRADLRFFRMPSRTVPPDGGVGTMDTCSMGRKEDER